MSMRYQNEQHISLRSRTGDILQIIDPEIELSNPNAYLVRSQTPTLSRTAVGGKQSATLAGEQSSLLPTISIPL